MKPGWKNEKERHSLARKGIPTKTTSFSTTKVMNKYEKLVEKHNGIFFENCDSPENGLLVEDYGNGYVRIVEWTDASGLIDDLDKNNSILRTEAVVGINELMYPKSNHRGSYSRDTGTGELTKESLISSSLSYMAYWGGTETFVSSVGD